MKDRRSFHKVRHTFSFFSCCERFRSMCMCMTDTAERRVLAEAELPATSFTVFCRRNFVRGGWKSSPALVVWFEPQMDEFKKYSQVSFYQIWRCHAITYGYPAATNRSSVWYRERALSDPRDRFPLIFTQFYNSSLLGKLISRQKCVFWWPSRQRWCFQCIIDPFAGKKTPFLCCNDSVRPRCSLWARISLSPGLTQ